MDTNILKLINSCEEQEIRSRETISFIKLYWIISIRLSTISVGKTAAKATRSSVTLNPTLSK